MSGHREFHRHLERVLERVQGWGSEAEFIPPEECTEEQLDRMSLIVTGRQAEACAVFRAEGHTFMAYDDHRYPYRIAYLVWDGTTRLWAAPSGASRKFLERLEPKS